MANYAIMRIEKKTMGSVGAIEAHHERTKEKYKSNPDIDLERSHLNYHIVQPEGKYRQKIKDRIDESGAKQRKDSIVLQDCLITATPDWINRLSDEEQEEFFEHAYEFFAEKFGEQNIITAIVHRDEANPHMHLCFVPITEDNRLSSKSLIGGPKGLVKLQDGFHEHMVKEYPDLTRGISKTITHRKHISPQMYKQAASLYEHYEEMVAAINDIGIIGNTKKKEDALELLGKYAPDLAKVKDQLQSTEKYIASLESRIENNKRTIARKNDQLEEKDQALYQERSKVYALETKQKHLVGILNQIPKEVLDEVMKDRKAKERDAR